MGDPFVNLQCKHEEGELFNPEFSAKDHPLCCYHHWTWELAAMFWWFWYKHTLEVKLADNVGRGMSTKDGTGNLHVCIFCKELVVEISNMDIEFSCCQIFCCCFLYGVWVLLVTPTDFVQALQRHLFTPSTLLRVLSILYFFCNISATQLISVLVYPCFELAFKPSLTSSTRVLVKVIFFLIVGSTALELRPALFK